MNLMELSFHKKNHFIRYFGMNQDGTNTERKQFSDSPDSELEKLSF